MAWTRARVWPSQRILLLFQKESLLIPWRDDSLNWFRMVLIRIPIISGTKLIGSLWVWSCSFLVVYCYMEWVWVPNRITLWVYLIAEAWLWQMWTCSAFAVFDLVWILSILFDPCSIDCKAVLHTSFCKLDVCLNSLEIHYLVCKVHFSMEVNFRRNVFTFLLRRDKLN